MAVHIDEVLESIEISSEDGSNLHMEFSDYSKKNFLFIGIKGSEGGHGSNSPSVAKILTVEETKTLVAFLNKQLADIELKKSK